ncbi:hypothetical protein A9Q79_01360 [Methylophaga sp. 42_25_T18]|nr:hypothetical protein A9Q79_01360 [Methylophaga sp. 42_25_T18]OUR86496.1 hypothetical protein A9Q92_05535 [Methylophaga sp. 42_8_T64]
MAMAKYKRSKLGTESDKLKDKSKDSLFWTLFGKLLSLFIPNDNPDYENKFILVHEWLIEFDEDGHPDREIGLNTEGKPVIAGPDERNYGFWLDTNMRINDFENNEISSEYFETKWNTFLSNGGFK